MSNSEYWARRFKELEDTISDHTYEFVENLEKQFDYAIWDIETKMRAWYQRFADNNKISLAESKRLLKSDELKEFKWTVQEYIEKGKEMELSGAWIKELENASARVHISRLDTLKLQLRQYAEMLTKKQIEAVTDAAEYSYTESYYHTAFEFQKGIGIGWTMQGVNQNLLNKVLSQPWTVDGMSFTARCWTNKDKLVEVLNRELTRMVATGAAPDRTIETIAKQFNTSKRNAGRVVMTESAAFSSAARKDCFNELDVEMFEFVAALDHHTCDLCGEMDGKVFKMSEYQVGVTAEPLHPCCRCTTAPYFEDMAGLGERYARDIGTGKTYKVPSDMTYKQWKAKQDEKYGAGSVDLARKKEYNKSADKVQFKRYQSTLRELSPDTFDDFQNIKYSNPEKWKTLKYQYRTLNQYKMDSGSISAQDILDLDDKIISEKRNNFTSKYKKSGNIAGAYLDGISDDLFLAHSKIDTAKEVTKYKGKSKFVTLKEQRLFKYVDVTSSNGSIRTNTYVDTEAKLFEAFADMYEEKPFKSITMLSERGMCDSCKGVMAQFKEKYPNVIINVVSNKKTEGNVWKNRRR